MKIYILVEGLERHIRGVFLKKETAAAVKAGFFYLGLTIEEHYVIE